MAVGAQVDKATDLDPLASGRLDDWTDKDIEDFIDI